VKLHARLIICALIIRLCVHMEGDLPLLPELWNLIAMEYTTRCNAVLLRMTCRTLYKAIAPLKISTEEAFLAGWYILVIERSNPQLGAYLQGALRALILKKHPYVIPFLEERVYVHKLMFADERITDWICAATAVGYDELLPVLCAHITHAHNRALRALFICDRKDLLMPLLVKFRRECPKLDWYDAELMAVRFVDLGMDAWFNAWKCGIPLPDDDTAALDMTSIAEPPAKRARHV
jgi:hypothetical protein